MQEEESGIGTQSTPGAVIPPTVNPNTSQTPADSPSQNEEPSSPQPQAQAAPVISDDQAGVQIPANETSTISDDNISWTGPEFATQDKPSSWATLFVVAAVIVAACIYFITKDVVSSAAVGLAIIFLCFYSLRKPKDINYSVNDMGMTIGSKSFNYHDFRSFSVAPEGTYINVTFLPLKRFSPPIGMCCLNKDSDAIVDFLSNRLPLEHHRSDAIDSFMKRIKF